MTVKYAYTMNGEAADGQTWSATGMLELATPADFPLLSSMALRDSFEKLTNGKAVYGRPGLGCTGPYKVTKLLIEFSEPKALHDPTYNRDTINGNPEWELAFTLSEIDNDDAPIGWSRYIATAKLLMSNYEIRRKSSA